MQMFRIAIRVKETDKRKNATVYRFVVLAESLNEAKTLAAAKWVDPPDYDYRTHDLDKIAAITGHAMNVLAYNADIYGEKDKAEYPETVPTREAIELARAKAAAFEAAHEDDE